jgi:predicted phage baseplate assembly protein
LNSLSRIASDDAVLAGPVITAISNPIPASGGIDPETLDSIRQNAPYAFNIQNRAVTAADYGTMALRVEPTLQQAQGTFLWTGSWQTAFIAVEPQGTEAISAAQKTALIEGMDLYRMAGHDVDVDAPVYVSLEIVMSVCAEPGYLPADVQQAILQVLSTQPQPDGTPGLFAQSNFGFGQPVYLSPIVAAAQDVDGVSSVTVTTFQRQGQSATNAVSAGVIYLQSLEIARLENDPNYPEHGILTVTVNGGS